MESKTNSQNNRTIVALETLGCKLNQSETELFSRQLEQAGYTVVSPQEKADIYILNTCTVTHVADRKSRHLLRMARKCNPQSRIVAMGCYAELAARGLIETGIADLVLGNESKSNLLQILEDSGYRTIGEAGSQPNHRGRTRSFIKAQDGCNNFCSYCIVPVVRGREKSLSPDQVITEIKNRILDGYQEVVLTGTEIGSYRYGKLDLHGLLERVLSETEIKRLRLSSVQPQKISPQLLRLWREFRLCRHFHISLQSGSAAVLQRMNRGYNPAEYSETIDFIRSEIPGVAITTDLIVGFPGESEIEFQESYDFCRKMNFARIHVFPYSIREGTKAALMPDQIEATLKKERAGKMLVLANDSHRDFCSCSLGSTSEVLFEQASGRLWSGLTDTYIKVYTESTEDLTNKIKSVKLLELKGDGVWGKIVN